MAFPFKHYNNEMPGLENNFFRPAGPNLANQNKVELLPPRKLLLDLAYH